jgi:dienelactone hydrolase
MATPAHLLRRWLLKNTPAVSAGIAVFGIGIQVAVAAGTVASASGASASRPAESPLARLNPRPQRVVLTTDEEVPVGVVGTYASPAADTRKRRAPMAILLHDAGQDRSSFDLLVPVLHRAGFAVLTIDLRGHGDSVEPALLRLKARAAEHDPKLYRAMVNDVEAAYRWLARRPEADPARFVLVGAGLGGSVALDYAVRDRSVDGVILLTPKTEDPGLNTIALARKYTGRKLLLIATPEDRTAADALHALAPGSEIKVMSARAAEPAGSTPARGTPMLGRVTGLEAAIADFLVAAAGLPTAAPVIASMKGSAYYEPSSRQADQLNPDNLRYFSSPAEAQARGYKPPKQQRKQ